MAAHEDARLTGEFAALQAVCAESSGFDAAAGALNMTPTDLFEALHGGEDERARLSGAYRIEVRRFVLQ